MAKGEGLFWVASPAVAAYQIVKAIEKIKNPSRMGLNAGE